MTTEKILGIIFSIVGLWLGSSGIVGEERLRNIEIYLRNNLYGPDGIIIRLLRFILEIISIIFHWVYSKIGLFLIILLAITIIFGIYGYNEFIKEFDNLKSISAPIEYIISFGFLFCGLYIFLMVIFAIITRVIPGVVILIASLPVVISLGLILAFILVWFITIPYKIADMISVRLKLSSTFVLLGIFFGVIGIILLEMS